MQNCEKLLELLQGDYIIAVNWGGNWGKLPAKFAVQGNYVQAKRKM